MAAWCNPLTLQLEHSGGVGSNPGRAAPLERHDKGSWIRLGLLYNNNNNNLIIINNNDNNLII